MTENKKEEHSMSQQQRSDFIKDIESIAPQQTLTPQTLTQDIQLIFVMGNNMEEPKLIEDVSTNTFANDRNALIYKIQKQLYDKYSPIYRSFPKISYTDFSYENINGVYVSKKTEAFCHEILRIPLTQAKDKIPMLQVTHHINDIAMHIDACKLEHPGAFSIIKRFFEIYGDTPNNKIKTSKMPFTDYNILLNNYPDEESFQLAMKIIKGDKNVQLIESVNEKDIIDSVINISSYFGIQKLFEIATSFSAFTLAYYSECNNEDFKTLDKIYGVDKNIFEEEELKIIVSTLPEFFIAYDIDNQITLDAYNEYISQATPEEQIPDFT